MRLQKFMADAGIASRRKCEEYIAAGQVKVNGVAASLGCTIDPEHDTVEFSGKTLRPQNSRVILMFYKPRGVVCTSQDPQGRKTVLDCVREIPLRLYSVGRLDIDSEGLILITNNGELAYRLTHPKFALNKTYFVICDGALASEQIQKLEDGILLDDGMTAPAQVRRVTRLKSGDTSLEITIHEGRNRQIRRMLNALGHNTQLLRRVQIGPLKLGDLQRGTWRYLTDAESHSLMEAAGCDTPELQ